MTAQQTSLLDGDLGAQRRFELQALLETALRDLRAPETAPRTVDRATEAHLLGVVRSAAAELRTLPVEPPVPF